MASSEKKAFPLRLDPALHEAVERLAAAELRSINAQLECLLREGAELVAFHSPEDDLAAEFGAKFPQARRVADRRAILDDQSIPLVLTAAIPADRAGIAIEAMQHGKDVMSDKPGMTTFEQLAELRRVQAETGRIFSVYYEERFENQATIRAGQLVRDGAIGQFVHMLGLGPHLIRKPSRPGWFFERSRYGGIIKARGIKAD